MSERRLDGLLSHAAAQFPDRCAIGTDDDSVTFAELELSAARIAGALRAAVGRAATPVGVASVLSAEFAAAYYGVSRSENTVVLINPMLREQGLLHVFRTAAIRIAFVPIAVATMLLDIRAQLPELREIIILDGDIAPTGTRRLVDFAAQAEPVHTAERNERNAIACIQFTSGTTGAPKGVLLSHENLLVNAEQVAVAHSLTADSVTTNHLPLYHMMHLNSAVFAGASQWLCRNPDPATALRFAAQRGTTHFYSLPVRLARLATQASSIHGWPHLRAVLSGGSALAGDVAGALSAALGVPVLQGYGLAELSPLSHNDIAGQGKPGSVGPTVARTECRVIDLDTKTPLGPGRPGEVLLRGPQLMRGYLGADTGADAEGWFHTGDIGYQDAQGWLFLVDRIKDVFKVDNEIVSPSEVERAVRTHPLVRDCVVADLPDEFSGAKVVAGIVPADIDGDLERIRVEVNAKLTAHEQIRTVFPLSEVPRTPNGKVDRKLLRREFSAIPV